MFESRPHYKKLALTKYKQDIRYQFSSGKRYVLCVHQTKPSSERPLPPLSFFVYDLKQKKIVHEASLQNGEVSWRNEYQLQITYFPGIVKVDDEKPTEAGTYIYDLRLKRRLYMENNKTRVPQKR